MGDSEPIRSIQNFESLCQSADVEKSVTFIGGGNMAQAMIQGFLKSGFVEKDAIFVGTPRPTESLKLLKVQVETSNRDVLQLTKGGIVILCCKPYQLNTVTAEAKDLLRDAGLLISVIAGLSTETIRKELEDWEKDRGMYPPIVRVVPNTPSSIGCGATVFCRDKNTSHAEAHLVKCLMETFGTCDEIPEKNINAAQAISGCGPAFVFTMIDALSDGGVKMGLPRQLATHLAAQTLMGASKMILETGEHPGKLKNAVCSPGGTTIAGIHTLEDRDIVVSIVSKNLLPHGA